MREAPFSREAPKEVLNRAILSYILQDKCAELEKALEDGRAVGLGGWVGGGGQREREGQHRGTWYIH
jgi:hypothetical protein